MKITLQIILVCVWILVAGSATVSAQTKTGTPKINIEISIREVRVEERKISFSYTINYDGVVEVSLINSANKVVFRAQTINKVGENWVSITRKPEKGTPGYGKYFPPGTYNYVLFYKGNKKVGVFTL
jgi:hypothetical protein